MIHIGFTDRHQLPVRELQGHRTLHGASGKAFHCHLGGNRLVTAHVSTCHCFSRESKLCILICDRIALLCNGKLIAQCHTLVIGTQHDSKLDSALLCQHKFCFIVAVTDLILLTDYRFPGGIIRRRGCTLQGKSIFPCAERGIQTQLCILDQDLAFTLNIVIWYSVRQPELNLQIFLRCINGVNFRLCRRYLNSSPHPDKQEQKPQASSHPLKLFHINTSFFSCCFPSDCSAIRRSLFFIPPFLFPVRLCLLFTDLFL